jgi:hypothetical protein
MDNIFVERLWRSLKYEEVYLNAYATVAEAKTSIGAWLSFYNEERQHQSLGYHTPRQIYQDGLWICGRSASPTGCASPASRASSESGEMLAFAHMPTGATADTGYTLRSGSGCRTFGVHLSKFVGAPWLSKLLNKISFLSGSAESAGRTGSFIDGKLSRG